jgi:glycosyltransferase involved in cell wall biosynthesis
VKSPLLIALPDGLSVSGISMWAVRLANTVVHRGRAAGLILHQEPPGCRRIDVPIDPRVLIFPPPSARGPLPRLESSPGDLSPFVPEYRAAAAAMAGSAGAPVILSSNLHGDCYGAAAAVLSAEPDLVRIVAWHHSDIEYNNRILAHYAPFISRFAAVSDAIFTVLRERLPARAADIVNIPYGIDPGPPPALRPYSAPIRLIYTGRLEHEQKRIAALPHLVDELAGRGIPHQLTVVGDGPAAAELARLARSRPTMTLLPPLAHAGSSNIVALLDRHDAFVLASRYEGLSVAMLEAMARGCIPILTRTRSGAAQAVETGLSGELADADPDADAPAAARALADSIQRHLARGPARRLAMSAAARHTVIERFSLEQHVAIVEAFLVAAAATPASIHSAQNWPGDRPFAFTAAPGQVGSGSGSVPPDGAARLARLLASLDGLPLVVHGTGQHTRQLADVFARSSAPIVAFTDDDPRHHGSRLWDRPILPPADAAAAGAADLIISSWMHQETIWARRAIYESQGLRVHRIY